MRRERRLFLIPILVIALGLGGLELRHYARFHDFFGYGWHADLVARDANIGVPGVQTMYALWLNNFTVHSQILQGVQLPGGYVGSGVLYRDEIQKWDVNTRSWVTVTSTTKSDWGAYPLVTRKVWPTQLVAVSGWDAIGGREGINKGDKVRIAVFSSFTEDGAKVFYSPEFVIHDQRQVTTNSRVR